MEIEERVFATTLKNFDTWEEEEEEEREAVDQEEVLRVPESVVTERPIVKGRNYEGTTPDRIPPLTDDEKRESDLQRILGSDDPGELLTYFHEQFLMIHEFEYKGSWIRDLGIIRQVIQNYGRQSGEILMYLFHQCEGMWRGEIVVVTFLFQKVVVEEVYTQMKKDKVALRRSGRKTSTAPVKTKGRMLSGDDFLTQLAD